MTALPAPYVLRAPNRVWNRPKSVDPSTLALRNKVVTHIAAHATDPDTTPDSVAADLGITKRTLVRLFENSDKRPEEHLAEARLHAALTALREPDSANRHLAEIATRAGYACPTRMASAVLLATGLTPAAYRQQD